MPHPQAHAQVMQQLFTYCVKVRIACTNPCATCSTSSTTCTSCLIGHPYLHNTVCYMNCPSGTYASSSSTCSGNVAPQFSIQSVYLACTSPCATCSTSGTTCTSCQSTHPHFYNNVCYDICPSGSYPSSSSTCTGNTMFYFSLKLWLACASSCATCSTSSTTCTSCKSTKQYLYNNVCYATCPSGTYASSSSACTGNFFPLSTL